MTQTVHAQRIKQELHDAGVTAFGQLKFSIRFLPEIIGDQEHIVAVVYGRYQVGEGSQVWRWEEGALVATNFRVIFVDRKPAFLRADNIPYDSVAGVESLKAWPFSAVTLITRVGSFSLRYVKMSSADKFVHYVEQRTQK